MSSDASNKSDRSLRSHGAINPTELPKKKKRKPAAIWTPEEETAFVDCCYLSSLQVAMEIPRARRSVQLQAY
jgi:hypothetical protein